MNRKIKNNSGTSLVEMVLYIAIFSVLSVVVIDSLVKMTKSFAETSVQADFIQATNIMERMSREIRGSISINGTLATTDVTFNTTDSAGTAKTVRFYLSGTDLKFSDNGATAVNLNPTNIQVTSSLTFTQITTPQGVAIRIVMPLKDTKDKSSRTETFYNTVALRGSY